MLIRPIRNCLENLDLAFLKYAKSLSKSAPVSSMNTCVSVWSTANNSSKVVISTSWNGSSICKDLKTQSIHDHVVVDNCCILLYSLTLMFAHLIWNRPLHKSQQTARWLRAIVLEQTLRFPVRGLVKYRHLLPEVLTEMLSLSWDIFVSWPQDIYMDSSLSSISIQNGGPRSSENDYLHDTIQPHRCRLRPYQRWDWSRNQSEGCLSASSID